MREDFCGLLLHHAGLFWNFGAGTSGAATQPKQRRMQALPFFKKKTLTGLSKTCG